MPKDYAAYPFANQTSSSISPRCPKCAAYRIGNDVRARCLHHTEACRARVYDLLRKEGSAKIKTADSDGGRRTQTTVHVHETSGATASSSSPPTIPRADDVVHDADPANDESLFEPSDEEPIVEPDAKYLEEVYKNAEDLLKDHDMVSMMDVLQTLNVGVHTASQFAASLVRDQGRLLRLLEDLQQKDPLLPLSLSIHPRSSRFMVVEAFATLPMAPGEISTFEAYMR